MGDINDGLHQLRMMFEERLHEVEYHKTSKNAVYQDYDKKKKKRRKRFCCSSKIWQDR